MTKGKAFTPREKRDVWEMRKEKYPSIIARHLVTMYPLDNGGQRTERGVRELLTRLRLAEQEGRLSEELGVTDQEEEEIVAAPIPTIPKTVKKHTKAKAAA